jgi:hypothetical protein
MALDSKSSRSNNATSRSAPAQDQPAPIEIYSPKSSHVADPALQPFLSSSFDAAEFLNATLPPLQSARPSQHAIPSHDVSLSELSTQMQTLLSHLSAHTTRLTYTLTQLTDEILRSGSRLAYEVEILRGETLGVSEVLTEGLQDDISKFIPEGLENHLRQSRVVDTSGARTRSSTVSTPKTPVEKATVAQNTDPEYIAQLRTLTLVRNRLETVIKTFGDAMAWTFPPSELSVSSSFLSVSAPEPGSEAHSIEEKGQQVSKQLRDEITSLLLKNSDPIDGIEGAAKRVEELKELSKVWKGTAEDKARVKFVESLAKMVEDRHRELLRESEIDGRTSHRIESINRGEASKSKDESATVHENKSQSGYGFINQLQKMRGGL